MRNATYLMLQSYVAKAYTLSKRPLNFTMFCCWLQPLVKMAPTDLNRKKIFFQKLNGGFI